MLLTSAFLLLFSRLALGANPFTLFAYGTDINGYPVVFADDLAYITNTTPSSGVQNPTNVTFSLNNGQLTVAPNTTANSNVTWTEDKYFYVVPNDAVTPVGFVNQSATPPDSATTEGFLLYGSQLMVQVDSQLLSQFWATEFETGLWALDWNESGHRLDRSVPVTLKTTPPTHLQGAWKGGNSRRVR